MNEEMKSWRNIAWKANNNKYENMNIAYIIEKKKERK